MVRHQALARCPRLAVYAEDLMFAILLDGNREHIASCDRDEMLRDWYCEDKVWHNARVIIFTTLKNRVAERLLIYGDGDELIIDMPLTCKSYLAKDVTASFAVGSLYVEGANRLEDIGSGLNAVPKPKYTVYDDYEREVDEESSAAKSIMSEFEALRRKIQESRRA